jgi:hypothetical protein
MCSQGVMTEGGMAEGLNQMKENRLQNPIQPKLGANAGRGSIFDRCVLTV